MQLRASEARCEGRQRWPMAAALRPSPPSRSACSDEENLVRVHKKCWLVGAREPSGNSSRNVLHALAAGRTRLARQQPHQRQPQLVGRRSHRGLQAGRPRRGSESAHAGDNLAGGGVAGPAGAWPREPRRKASPHRWPPVRKHLGPRPGPPPAAAPSPAPPAAAWPPPARRPCRPGTPPPAHKRRPAGAP